MIQVSEQREYIGNDWQDAQEPERARVVTLDLPAAQLVQRDYCCAGCWGHLNLYHVPESRQVRITCDNCGDGRGFVTKRYAENRRANSGSEAVEVNQLLREIGVLEFTRRSVSEVLADLGF